MTRCFKTVCPDRVQTQSESLRRFRFSILLILLLILFCEESNAFLFDRRVKEKAGLSYYIYPVVVDIPGIGEAIGGGGTVTRPWDTEMDITGVHLDGDFNIDILAVTDMPLYTPMVTLSPFYLHSNNVGVEQYERGSDSDPDRKYYLRANRLNIRGAELSLHLFEDQLEFYTMLVSIFVEPSSVIDPDGNEWSARLEEEFKSRAYILGFYLDDTDDRRDPRIGYRFKYERWGVLHEEKALGDGYQDDFDLAFYFPIIPETMVLIWDLFYSQATIVREGEIDSRDYQCPATAPAQCQLIADELRRQREEEVKKGNATSLGGTNRLRAYPQQRFYDSYTFFTGLELRWYFVQGWNPFDYYLWKGISTAFQFAVFHEWGQVSEENNHTLYEDMKNSTGIGIRAVLSDVVVRLDWAIGREGHQTTMFVGYPF